jgi:hypothetical protein
MQEGSSDGRGIVEGVQVKQQKKAT